MVNTPGHCLLKKEDRIMQLLGALEKVKSTGTDKWKALCPCHDEKTPSLVIKIADNGHVMIHCFGCGANGLDVYRKLGLSLDELFGGKKLESTHIPEEIQQSYNLEKVVVMIHQSDIDNSMVIKWSDRKRNKLAVARIVGIENKWPHIKE